MSRFVAVTHTGAISCEYFYSVEIPDDVSDDDAPSWAIDQIRSGNLDPYDSHTGDALDGDHDDYDAGDVQATDPEDDHDA